jgi:hypothetical protein
LTQKLKGGASGTAFSVRNSAGGSADGRRLAEVFAFHGHPAAAVAYELHGRQFAFADMGVIHIGGAAEGTILFVTAGAAQVAGFLGHGPTVFAGVSHYLSPLRRAASKDTSDKRDRVHEGRSCRAFLFTEIMIAY